MYIHKISVNKKKGCLWVTLNSSKTGSHPLLINLYPKMKMKAAGLFMNKYSTFVGVHHGNGVAGGVK